MVLMLALGWAAIVVGLMVFSYHVGFQAGLINNRNEE